MTRSVSVFGLALLAGVACGQSVVLKDSAQSGSSTPYDTSYSRSSRVTITGKLSGIGISKPSSGMPNNVRYIVQIAGKPPSTVVVEMGPQWFVDSQKTHPRLGQWIRVTGSRVTDKGETKILASQVVLHDHQVLTLRRPSGTPYWVQKNPPPQTNALGTNDYVSEPSRLAAEGTILGTKIFTINGADFIGYTVQTATGPTDVIVAPVNYPRPTKFNVGDSVQVYSTGYVFAPSFVGTGLIVGSSVYGGDGTMFIGPGGLVFPGYQHW